MSPPRSTPEGEVLKLGPPISGELTIMVDSSVAGASFAAGTHVLLPGAMIPVHRHLERDQVVFIHKGQGRATLNEQIIIVGPGKMLTVPRGMWYGLRNTGTGALQIAWAAAPGIETFFRNLSRLGPVSSPETMQELAQRNKVEFRPLSDEPAPRPKRRRGSRGGRGSTRQDTGGTKQKTKSPPEAPVSARVGAASSEAASQTSSGATRGRRRHRRGGKGRKKASPEARPKSVPESRGGQQRKFPGRRPKRIKEIYTDGRWVRTEGEGPVIGSELRRSQRSGKRSKDDEPPPARLSVPL